MRYAARVYGTTCCYDGGISRWLGESAGRLSWPSFHHIAAYHWGRLRYGENPHQQARLLRSAEGMDERCTEPDLLLADTASQDDERSGMSFNNYADAHSALELCKELTRAESTRVKVCLFVKHTNPCGVGLAADPVAAYRLAYSGDANAAMGGVLACNFEVDPAFAAAVMDTYSQWGKTAGAGGFFVEVWIAPSFQEEARGVIRTSKPWGQRARLLGVGDVSEPPDPSALEFKSITGGLLLQSRDLIGLNEDQWKVVTRRRPSTTEMSDLRLAWLVCKHTRSNAITICKDGMLIGNGAGQMSRVMSCRIATWLARENGHTEKLAGSAAASDAFFPFSDGPKILMDAGVTAIIQPGGSKRDEDTIAACDERGAAMIITGTRHFRH